jgi:hypothetical protein
MANEGKPGNASPEYAAAFSIKLSFPDPQGVFDTRHPSLESIKDDSFIILDASVLLFPYKMDAVSLPDVIKAYEPLREAGRLLIPAQAAREFAKNRARNVADITKALRNEASVGAPKFSKKFGALLGNSAFCKLQAEIEDAASKLTKLRKSINRFADDLELNVGDDPVSEGYRKLFDQAVLPDPPECEDQQAFISDMKKRYEARIPPGYKDKGKFDGGSGDLIIWKTILHEGKERGSNCIFVTAEEKSDWFIGDEGSSFQTRFELIEEYRVVTGKSIHIISLSRLLKLFEASGTAVFDVEKVENMNGRPARKIDQFASLSRERQREIVVDLRYKIERLDKLIEEIQASLAILPPFDGNLSLPWNRKYHALQTQLGDLIYQRSVAATSLDGMNLIDDYNE